MWRRETDECHNLNSNTSCSASTHRKCEFTCYCWDKEWITWPPPYKTLTWGQSPDEKATISLWSSIRKKPFSPLSSLFSESWPGLLHSGHMTQSNSVLKLITVCMVSIKVMKSGFHLTEQTNCGMMITQSISKYLNTYVIIIQDDNWEDCLTWMGSTVNVFVTTGGADVKQ